jgi:dipeptidyl aminopeptidase/acylaminoacyl peptidase
MRNSNQVTGKHQRLIPLPFMFLGIFLGFEMVGCGGKQPMETLPNPLQTASPTQSSSLYPKGKIVFSAESDLDYQEFIINPDGTQKIKRDRAENIRKILISPTQDKIAFNYYNPSTGKTAFEIANIDGTDPIKIGENQEIISFDWSPDGTKVVFVSFYKGIYKCVIVDSNGSNEKIIEVPKPPAQVAWAPDGSGIAVNTWGRPYAFNQTIYFVKTSGEVITLTEPERGKLLAGWSSSEKRLAFVEEPINVSDSESRAYRLYTINADGTNRNQMALEVYLFSVSWSPDGKTLLYTSTYLDKYTLHTIKFDGTDRRQLTSDSSNNKSPSWSPDGKKIVFESDRDGNSEIYTMDADGSNQKRLTETPFIAESYPRWY